MGARLTVGLAPTSIGITAGFAFSCQTFSVYFPGGTSFSTNFPSLPVVAKYGVSVTMTYADISACTLQSSVQTPGLSNWWYLVCFWGYVPRSNRGGPGENTLWRISSLFGNATFVPASTG